MVCPQLPPSRIAPETAKLSRATLRRAALRSRFVAAAQSSPRRNPARLGRSQTGFPAAGSRGSRRPPRATDQPRRIVASHAFSAGRNVPELRSQLHQRLRGFSSLTHCLVGDCQSPQPPAEASGVRASSLGEVRAAPGPGASAAPSGLPLGDAGARGGCCSLGTATFRRIKKPRSQPWGAPPGLPRERLGAGIFPRRPGPSPSPEASPACGSALVQALSGLFALGLP